MYLYHRVPPNMVGTTLLPLNRQKDIYPEVYRSGAQKYKGREALMDAQIPYLNCAWNDVLFTMAVHPLVFLQAYYAAGFPRRMPLRYFQIPLHNLDCAQLAVLTRMGMNSPREYAPFSAQDMPAYAQIPPETFAYWAEQKRLGNDQPLLYMHIPHILYLGEIDVSNAAIIEEKTPD